MREIDKTFSALNEENEKLKKELEEIKNMKPGAI